MKNAMKIVYFGAFILGIICIIGSLAVGGSTDALIVGLFMMGAGWFGGDLETIKDDIELMRIARQKRRNPEDRQDAPKIKPVADYQITECQPRTRSRY